MVKEKSKPFYRYPIHKPFAFTPMAKRKKATNIRIPLAAISSQSDARIERETESLRLLYAFLETKLPWGKYMTHLRGKIFIPPEIRK